MIWSCWSPQIASDSDSDVTGPCATQASSAPGFEASISHCVNGGVAENACTVKMPFLDEASNGFFALFEGHRNGLVASRTSSLHLPQFLRQEILTSPNISSHDMRECFENAFAKTDEYLKTIAVDRGTSATACLVRKQDNVRRLHVSNVGNTRAVLCRGATAIRLTEEHTAESEAERGRLAACKAYTHSGRRLQQLLPSSRALGDHLLKDWVISTPHYFACDLTPDDSLVVCTTSSISSVLSDQDIADIALAAGAGAKAASDALLEEAVQRWARGALAVLAVRLDCEANGSRGDGSSHGGSWRSGGRSRSARSSVSSRSAGRASPGGSWHRSGLSRSDSWADSARGSVASLGEGLSGLAAWGSSGRGALWRGPEHRPSVALRPPPA
jgi:serine/threonine protein phosphatase PrpC